MNFPLQLGFEVLDPQILISDKIMLHCIEGINLWIFIFSTMCILQKYIYLLLQVE